MKWLPSLGVAIVTSILGLVAAGLVGGLLAEWYHVSTFEGAAGFFVIAIAIFGLIGSFVIGLVTSLVISRRPNFSFLRSLGISCAIVGGILAAVAGVGRLLADIPPTLDGEALFLQIELRWPASGGPDPRSLTGAGYTRLGTSNGSVVRRQEDGPLFLDDARQEDRRWIVPGAVDVFTSRGQRVLDVGVGDTRLGAFVVPLPGHPRREHQQWSDWLPHARPGAAPLPDQFSYRFRVVRQSEPLRVERIGSFDIAEVVNYFHTTQNSDGMGANSKFLVSYKGQPVAGLENSSAVALIAAPRPTLLVHTEQPDGASLCVLAIDEGDRTKTEKLGPCTAPPSAMPITSDAVRFRNAKGREPVPGWVDRTTFATPGLYMLDDAVLDTRSNRFFSFTQPSPYPISNLPPLGLSSDERSFVRYAQDGSEDQPVLVVVDFHDNRSYSLPIDRSRMRFSTYEALDPEWVDHHFQWTRSAEGGRELLVERADFAVLPYKGEFTPAPTGQYQTYTIRPGKEPLRAAVVSILLSQPDAERLPDELSGYQQRVRIDGRVLSVTVVDSVPYVYVSMENGKQEPEFMTRIARLLDEAFATGKYDAAFEPRSRTQGQ